MPALHLRAARAGLIVLSLASSTFAAPASQPAPGRRPNIVLIMADDMGYSDLGCYGSEIATPNLDRLAAGGIRFTQFYNNARCCPTRASLLTGLYSHQAGVGHMVGDGGTPAYQGYLNEHCVTVAEVLRTAGYRTYMAGKWHVGEDRPHWPTDRGFEHYFGLISGASNYFRLEPGRKMARDDQPYVPDDPKFYMTDAFTDAAVKFVDQPAEKNGTGPFYRNGPQGATQKTDLSRFSPPFFLYLAYTSPHWPLHAWPEDIAKYRGKYREGWDVLRRRRHERMIEMGIVDSHWPLTPRDEKAPAWEDVTDKDDLDLRMAVYAAQIDRMDQNIGKVLDAIRRTHTENNTLIMFLADNGGCAEEVNRGKKGVPAGDKDSFFSYGLPWANASNTPFRLYKHWDHEGGISTPFIAYWPAVIRASGAPGSLNPAPTSNGGTLCKQVGHIIDVMATCVDVAEATYPTTYHEQAITPLEGKSLVPAFEGKSRFGHDVLYWEHERNRAVRQGDWKLVAQAARPWELYDLAADRTEMNNLADKHADKVSELAALYARWAERVGVKEVGGKGKK